MLHSQPADIAPQLGQLLALGRGQAVLPPPRVQISLLDPAQHRVRRDPELLGDLVRSAPTGQRHFHHLVPELFGIGLHILSLAHSWGLLAPPSRAPYHCRPSSLFPFSPPKASNSNFISAYGRDETVVRALDAGVGDFIVKPFSPSELTARVRAALRRQSAPRALRAGRPVGRLRAAAGRREGPAGGAGGDRLRAAAPALGQRGTSAAVRLAAALGVEPGRVDATRPEARSRRREAAPHEAGRRGGPAHVHPQRARGCWVPHARTGPPIGHLRRVRLKDRRWRWPVTYRGNWPTTTLDPPSKLAGSWLGTSSVGPATNVAPFSGVAQRRPTPSVCGQIRVRTGARKLAHDRDPRCPRGRRTERTRYHDPCVNFDIESREPPFLLY